MASSKMFIPNKIKVGYQKREGTYTGKLAYVIYFDEKGKLRKESSWSSWRDKKIDPQEFENKPTEGFVLNKGVGGVRDSWSSWNTRNEYIRVYDPRDFEFEISVANLLFILQETSAIKGKGLEGEFVYSWQGTELVLLPVESAEYTACKSHTERQSKKVTKEYIKEGYTYILKDETNVMYIGRYPYNNLSAYSKDGFYPVGNRHIFLKLEDDEHYPYFTDTGFTKLAECTSTAPAANYADARDKFLKSKYYAGVESLEVVKNTENIDFSKDYYTPRMVKVGDRYKIINLRYTRYWDYHRTFDIYESSLFTPQIVKGSISLPSVSRTDQKISENDLKKLEIYNLYVITDSKSKIKVI